VFVVLKGPRRGLPLSAEGLDEILGGARRRAGLRPPQEQGPPRETPAHRNLTSHENV